MTNATPTEICTTKSPRADLTFDQLAAAYQEAGKALGEGFEADLQLRTPKGAYNLLAFLLSDQNDQALVINRYSGFDKNISIDAIRFGGCLAKAYNDLLGDLKHENRIRSKGFERGINDQVDLDVLLAALSNAVAHNDWVGCGAPMVDLFCDRYEIISFGMDPVAADADSAPVWPELHKVLVDLGICAGTGEGVAKIVDAYGADALTVPSFGLNVLVLPFILNTLYSGKFATPMLSSVDRLCDVMGDDPHTAEELMYLMQEALYSALMERYVEPAIAEGKVKKVGESQDSRQQQYQRV